MCHQLKSITVILFVLVLDVVAPKQRRLARERFSPVPGPEPPCTISPLADSASFPRSSLRSVRSVIAQLRQVDFDGT